MPDAKVTDLNPLVVAADEDLLYIVDDPAGAPEGKKIEAVDFLRSLTLVGTIFTQEGTGSQAITADIWTKLTLWDYNGAQQNAINDQANGRIILNRTGLLLACWQLSLMGIANTIYDARIYWAGIPQPQTQAARKIIIGGDVGSFSSHGLIPIPATGQNLELWIRASRSGNITVVNGQLCCVAFA